MASDLFRQEVIEAGRDRLAGTVIAATPPKSSLYALLVLVFAGALVAILSFGTYASRAQVKGIVTFDRGLARVYSHSAAEIRQFHVQIGSRVTAGQPLVTLSMTQGRGGIGEQLAQLDRQDAELARQQQFTEQLGSTASQSLVQERASVAAAIASLARQRTLAADQIRLAESAMQRAVRLAGEGAGTQRQVEDSRSQLLSRRTELEDLTGRLRSQQEGLRGLDAQIAQRRIEAGRGLSELAAQRAVLAEQRAALMRTDQLVLTAPVSGEVTDIASEAGQRAQPQTALVTIVPERSRMEIWLYAPSRAIGFVRPGQEVRLLFDAFPYQKHGAGRGQVLSVSRVAVEPSALDPALGIQEPVFRIRVKLLSAPPRLRVADLRPGGTLSANLVLSRRRLWEVLFDPILTAIRT